MQSIYMFRNANVRTFNKVRERIRDWLKEKVKIESLGENYRSLESIVDFVNRVFLKDEFIECVPFIKRRKNENMGFVEIIISEDGDVEKEIRAQIDKAISMGATRANLRRQTGISIVGITAEISQRVYSLPSAIIPQVEPWSQHIPQIRSGAINGLYLFR